MNRVVTWCGAVFPGLAAVFLLASPAASQSSTSFYSGKTVSVMVGSSAGGGYDQYARTLARHYARAIPGTPAIVVKNMPGAGGLTAVLYLDATAPKDGTVITTFNAGLINDSLASGDKAKTKFSDYAWLGSITRTFQVCYSWNSTNIRTWSDLLARKEVVFGATGLNSNSYNSAALVRNIFGLNVKIIHAYPGNAELFLAVERGELDGSCTTWSSIPDDWILTKKINILTRLSPASVEGVPDSVKFIGDLASRQEQRDLLDAVLAAGEVGRPYVLSKEVPAERLEILSTAFAATMKDAQFLADAKKQGLPVDAVNSADAVKIVNRLYSFSPELIERAKKALE